MVLFHKNVFVREWTRRMVFPLHLILPSIRPIAYTLIAGMRAIHLLLEQNEIPFRPYHAYIIDKNYRFLCHFYGNESFTCESLLLRLYSEQYITISYWNRMNKIWYQLYHYVFFSHFIFIYETDFQSVINHYHYCLIVDGPSHRSRGNISAFQNCRHSLPFYAFKRINS